MKPTTRRTVLVYEGGLYRCCLATLVEWAKEAPDTKVEPGEVIACVYEQRPTMKVGDDGVIRWNGEG